jgi:Ca2+-binding EF-hand superfamily protein
LEEKESLLYLTQETLNKKLKIHFGHKCDFISRRLYFFLSDNINLKRISFKDFLDKMWFMWDDTTDRREVMKFAFKVYDIDNDGILEGMDLLNA